MAGLAESGAGLSSGVEKQLMSAGRISGLTVSQTVQGAAISFSLAKSTLTPVRLSAFDVRGRKVWSRTLPGRRGAHTILWDQSEIAAGTYLFRLTSDSIVLNRKAYLFQ